MRASGLAHLLWALVLVAPLSASAHPMGNFSISHYTAIRIEPDGVRLRYLVDLAEIPTFQALQESGLPAEPEHPAVRAYLARTVETLKDGLVLELDGRRLALRVESSELIFPPGAGGLPTLKIGAMYRAEFRTAESAPILALTYRDGNYPGRAGWKEIVATASGVRLLESTAPERDRSRELADYATDPSQSPPQDLAARVLFVWPDAPTLVWVAPVGRSDGGRPVEPGEGGPGVETARRGPEPVAPARGLEGRAPLPASTPTVSATGLPAPGDAPTAGPVAIPSLGLTPNVRGTPRDALPALIAGRSLGLGMFLFALAVTGSLGAFHALEPGHGKTVVAAYLVGSRGTAWHALLLGLMVTASHTAGVYLLGAVTLYASRYVVPERLYPWLGVASGLLIVALGLNLLYRRLAGGPGAAHGHDHAHGYAHEPAHEHGHSHAHSQPHEHGHPPRPGTHHAHDGAPDLDRPHAHDHGHGPHHVPDGPVSLRALVALGVSGGIVPCPAALVVLLSAVAMGRVGLGLLLIVAFSVGLAAVLIAIGLLVVCVRRVAARFDRNGIEGPLVRRWLPLTSAAVITLSGLVITAQALGR